MRALRVVLIGLSPLLADIIRRPVAQRIEAAGVMLSITDAETAYAAAAPDVLIIRQGAMAQVPARMPTLRAVLRLSDDLALMYGPGPDEATALTPDSLAAALLAIAQATI